MARKMTPKHPRGSWIPLAAVLAAAAALTAPAALAAPITFNTALPVAKGETVMRVQSKYLHAGDDPTPADRRLDVWAFPIVGVYGLTPRLAAFAVLPILNKKLDASLPAGRRSRSVAGIGDLRLFARYTLWQRDRPGRTLRIAPFAGLETPTGRDDATDDSGRLPRPLQPGSGSWDPFAGVVATWQTLGWEFDAAAAYQYNTRADDFRFGEEIRLDASFQYRLWPRTLRTGVPAFVYGVLEGNLVQRAKNVSAGIDDPDSGGTTFYVAPGLQYVTRRMVVEAAIQLPVFQDLNGQALENDFIGTFSVRVNF